MPQKSGMTNTEQRTIAADSIDLTCDVCPMTFVKAKLHLERMAAGVVLEVVLKDVEAVRNLAMNMKGEGHRVEAVRQDGDSYYVLVRKV